MILNASQTQNQSVAKKEFQRLRTSVAIEGDRL